jgi:hypothetical protein
MPLLPYCPNCRHEIDEGTLGWFCRRLRSPLAANVATRSAAEASVDAHYGDEPSRTGSFTHARKEGKLCGRYNPPGSSACTAEWCVAGPEGGAKKRPHFWDACSFCGMEVPNLDPNVSARTITIAGPSAAGKTHYIVALNEWWNKFLPHLGLMASPAMGRQVIELFKAMRNQVINQKAMLPATPPGDMISFSWQILPPAFSGKQGLLCTLPDVSGERLLDVNALAENRHFHHAAGVILLLDGARIAVSHELASPDSLKVGDTMDHHELVLSMIQDMRERLDGPTFCAMPIAVCINKVDLLGQLDRDWEDLHVTYQCDHSNGFDVDTCTQRSHAIASLLRSHGETAAIERLCVNNFDNVMFFAMATIGSDVTPVRFRPYCVEDPFLWMLWHLGML